MQTQTNNVTDASLLTLTCFVADMTRAFALLKQVECRTLPVSVDVELVNKTANFTSRATRARIWLSAAVKLCKRHGIALPRMRRVTADERTQFARALSDRVWCSLARHGYDAHTGQEMLDASMDAVHVEVCEASVSMSDAAAHSYQVYLHNRTGIGARIAHGYPLSCVMEQLIFNEIIVSATA